MFGSASLNSFETIDIEVPSMLKGSKTELVAMYIQYTCSAVPQPGRLLQQPYKFKASDIPPPASGVIIVPVDDYFL